MSEKSPNLGLPLHILADLPWSFTELAAADVGSFVEELRAYGDTIHVDVDERELQTRFPGTALNVKWAYWVREPSDGEWRQREAVVKIRCEERPSYAQVLFSVHAAVHSVLSDQDHHFFEGLQLVQEAGDDDVPVYEMHLGS